MKKLIKLDFNNTTRERKTENSYSELYSYDKNNGSFEFEILNDTLTTEQVIALFKFTESNKIWKTTGTVEGNKVKVTFDTTLITQNETVICYLYFDEEQRTSDTFRFKFKVKVSEIDKMNRYEVKERFINNTVIVDRLDVVTKDELKEALKNVGGIATEGLLTEVKAEELYAKKSEAVDNTNFELVKNRVLALELKTDKDTVYDDSELKGRISVLEAKEDNNTIYDDTNVRERLTALESKANVDVNNLVTKDELASKNYLTEHQDTSNFALKSEIPQQYNDTEVKERLTTLENKAPVDLSGYATKEELHNISGSQPTVDNLVTKEELEAKHYISDVSNLATKEELQEVRNSQPTVDTSHLVTKQELEEKQYLTTHQDLSEYAKKSELYNDSDLKARVEVLEKKTDKDTVYDDTQLKERVTALESKAIEGGAYDDSDLRNRVVALETKEDKDTKYDDTEVKHRLTELENKPAVDTSFFVTEEKLNSKGYISDISGLATKQELANVVTKEELEDKHYVTTDELNNKGYLKTHQNLDNVVTKEELATKGYITDVSNLVTKEELESKNYLTTPYNDTPLKERVEVLENKVDKDTVYNDTELRNRVEVLENKPNVDLSNYVTNEQLENKHYLTQHQELSHLATTSDLEVLRNISVNKAELSRKVDTTEYNTFKDIVVTKDELAGKNYLTETAGDEKYALKSEAYNDSALVSRVTALENRPTVDTSHSDSNEKVDATEYNSFKEATSNVVNSVKNRLSRVEKSLLEQQPNQTLSLNNGTLSISGGNSVTLPASQYEIHGTGMPNGVVEAEIGTTYIDKNKTTGAFKWIKTTDGGNQGWEVLTGDTGWRTLPLINKRGNAKLQIRRINDEVIVKFDGLDWGWFGVSDMNNQDGNIVDKTIAGKRYTWIKLNVGQGNNVLPEGFRSASSLLSGLYGDLGDLLGSVYVGGTDDSNAIQLRYAMTRNELTSDILSQIRISPITFVTDDGWPTQLP